MPACANCARELRPEWKFCVSCGMPTGVTAARPETKAIPIVAAPAAEIPPVAPEPEPAPEHQPISATRVAPVLTPATALAPTAIAPAPALVADPAPASVVDTASEPEPVAEPELEPELETDPEAAAPLALRTRARTRARRRVNALAIVALVLGCLASPLAALFGHLALHQVTVGDERGRIPAIIAIVLGYGSLAFIVGLAIIYLTSHA